MRINAARPRDSQMHRFLPFLALKLVCCVVILKDLLLGNDEAQCLSSKLVAQRAAIYEVLHSHTTATVADTAYRVPSL